MGSFRFYRRVRILPGLTVNVSKSGPSLSVGIRGAHVTVGRRGVTRTVGLPGSGIFYTSRTGYHTGVHSAHREPGPGADTAMVGWVIAAIVVTVLAMLLALAGCTLSLYNTIPDLALHDRQAEFAYERVMADPNATGWYCPN